MDLRKELGGKLEAALKTLLDEKVKGVTIQKIKEVAHEQIDALIDKHAGAFVEKTLGKLYEWVDKIDGEVDGLGETKVASNEPAPAPVESPVATSENIKG